MTQMSSCAFPGINHQYPEFTIVRIPDTAFGMIRMRSCPKIFTSESCLERYCDGIGFRLPFLKAYINVLPLVFGAGKDQADNCREQKDFFQCFHEHRFKLNTRNFLILFLIQSSAKPGATA